MGSKYYGETNLGTGGGGGGSSSSRKGKKSSSSSDKPKQPQRGLGVAQLEKIRLHTQMGCAYNNIIPPNYPFTNSIQVSLLLPPSVVRICKQTHACLCLCSSNVLILCVLFFITYLLLTCIYINTTCELQQDVRLQTAYSSASSSSYQNMMVCIF